MISYIFCILFVSSCAYKPGATLLTITNVTEEKDVDDVWNLDDIYHVQCSFMVHN